MGLSMQEDEDEELLILSSVKRYRDNLSHKLIGIGKGKITFMPETLM